MDRLRDRVAIVTGSASGIGRAIALRFGREGARVVVVTDRRVELGKETVELIQKEGGTAAFVQADVGVAADVERMVRFAVDTFGQLDILVNNAAWARGGPLLEMTEESWNRTMDVCLKSAWLGAKAAMPEMIKVGGGTIINISSVNGIAASPASGAYNAAKGGVNQLTRALAMDLGKHGIRVNAILPGHVATHPERYDDPLELWGFTEACPIGRVGTADDIAGAALYLASDDASWVTGSLLVVDGGMTAQVPEVLVASMYRRRYGRKPLRPPE
jgi:NAD(P)-dependent dehydrogenase (short-subunit alcohol dehydrogenase family)